MGASCKTCNWLPTAALSASGKRVEVRVLPLSPLSRAPLYLVVTVFYTLCTKIARGRGMIVNAERIFDRYAAG